MENQKHPEFTSAYVDLANTTGLPGPPSTTTVTTTTTAIPTTTTSLINTINPLSVILPRIDEPQGKEHRIQILSDTVLATLQSINATPIGAVGPKQSYEAMDTEPTDTKKRRGSSPDDFRYPKKTHTISTQFNSRMANVTTKNRYSALQDRQPEIESSAKVETEHVAITKGAIPKQKATPKPQHKSQSQTQSKATPSTSTAPMSAAKKPKIPPIIIDGIPQSHRTLVQDLTAIAKEGCSIKYTFNSTMVYTNTLQDFRRLKEALAEQQKQFHTYTDPTNINHAFVLRGLDADIDLDEVKNELEDTYDIRIKDIYKMKTFRRPLYLVIMPKEITLKYLLQNVTCINYIRVTWERRRNERRLTQCRRCQAWGHAASNCHRQYKCVKCGEAHPTNTCQKPLTIPPTCANCKGAHTACNTQCPIYQKRIELLEKATAKYKNTQYIPAPLPKTNAWTSQPTTIPTPNSQQQPTTSSISGTSATAVSAENRVSEKAELVSASGNANVGDLRALFGVVTEINTKINIKNALLAFQEFNTMLGDGNMDKLSKFVILEQFVTNILPKYDF